MTVIVKNNRMLDQALGLLQREVSRERILQTYREQAERQYPAKVRYDKRKLWMKTKVRRHRMKKRMRNRGQL